MNNRNSKKKGLLNTIPVILFIVISLLSPSLVTAGYVGDNIAIASKAYDQQNPHTIYLPDKNLWFVVWEDRRNFTTSGADIYGQFINGDDGNLCGDEFAIVNVQGNQTVPWSAYRDKDLLAAPSGDDTVLVVWQDTRGTTNAGYVYYSSITSFPDPSNCAAYVPPAPSSGTPIAFNDTNEYDRIINQIPTPTTQLIGMGDGTTAQFSAFLEPNVVPTSVTIDDPLTPQQAIDDGFGHFMPGADGTATGAIDYDTGAMTVTFGTGPPPLAMITATYTYNLLIYTFPEISAGDDLLSRKLPKISYDPVRDMFWIVWIESRNTLNRISQICFGLEVHNWQFGDNSFPGYVMLDGATFAELTNDIGVNGADIIRNARVRTNRLLCASHEAMKETYTYEYFTDSNNITTSNDTTSPEDFIVWEGVRRKGVLTCTCKDNNNNEVCDSADTITSSFESLFFEEDNEGFANIFGLFDKEISESVILSKRLSLDPANTSTAYYPSVAFDPVTKRFLVGWEDLRGGANTKIYGQIVYSGGGPYNDNLIISYEDTDGDGENDANVMNSKQTKPFVSYDGVNQRFFVIWQDGRNGTLSLENLDIYGQKVDAEGSLRGYNYAVFTLPYNQYIPTIAYNDVTNQFLTVWKDARNTDISTCSLTGGVGTGIRPCSSDVYGQRFTLGQPSLTLLKMDDTPLTPPLLSDYENPVGSGGVEVGLTDAVSFKIRNTGDTTLLIDFINEDLSCNGPAPPRDITPFSFDGLPSQLMYDDGITLDLVPSAELILTVRFTPTAGGSFNRCFIIESDGGSPQVNLSALSKEADITIFSPAVPYDFGTVYIGSYKDQTFVVKNTGIATLRITSLNNPVTPFSIQSDGCSGQDIAPGSTCNIVVRFTPTAVGPFNSQFGINSNDPDTPTLNVAISGTGQGAEDITVNPLNINFGDVQVGQNVQQNITVRNDGTAVLTINSVSSPVAPFSIVSNTCSPVPFTLAVGNSCQISVRFAPVTDGGVASNITIVSSDPDEGTVTVNLSGEGVVTPDINVSPSFLNFPSTPVGSTSSQNITVTNNGSANLNITGLTNPSEGFSISASDCPGTLIPLATCTITIVFAPTSAGFKQSSFVINSNDPDTPAYTVFLSGTGSVIPDISVVPTTLNFGNVMVGSPGQGITGSGIGTVMVASSSDQNITVTNNGTGNLTISSVTSPSAPFSITNNTCLGASISAGATCQITVRFAPTSTGTFNSSTTISSNDPDTPNVTVTMTGTGVGQTNIQVNPTSINFGTYRVGTTSSPSTVTVTNTGGADLVISSIQYPGTPFRVTSDTCKGKTLASSASCTITLVFNPTRVAYYNPYYLTISSNDPDTPKAKVTLTGKGIR
ncbi:MAG: choice-of-anchor D domain-containing protein [Nitrospirota bacterium]